MIKEEPTTYWTDKTPVKKKLTVATQDDEATEYVHPVPIEQRREFWNYGLNPITGLPPAKDSLESKQSSQIPSFAYEGGAGKCNGQTII